jgi:hypothetical protein
MALTGGLKTIKKFPLLSKNYVINEESLAENKMGSDDTVTILLNCFSSSLMLRTNKG